MATPTTIIPKTESVKCESLDDFYQHYHWLWKYLEYEWQTDDYDWFKPYKKFYKPSVDHQEVYCVVTTYNSKLENKTADLKCISDLQEMRAYFITDETEAAEYILCL